MRVRAPLLWREQGKASPTQSTSDREVFSNDGKRGARALSRHMYDVAADIVCWHPPARTTNKRLRLQAATHELAALMERARQLLGSPEARAIIGAEDSSYLTAQPSALGQRDPLPAQSSQVRVARKVCIERG